jgi:hypothetical protein
MARHGIGFLAILLGLIFNVRYFEDHDADWRVRCSWGSLVLFSMAVVTEWILGGMAPRWAGRHFWGFSLCYLISFSGSLLLAIVGKGSARIPLAAGSVILAWLYGGWLIR